MFNCLFFNSQLIKKAYSKYIDDLPSLRIPLQISLLMLDPLALDDEITLFRVVVPENGSLSHLRYVVYSCLLFQYFELLYILSRLCGIKHELFRTRYLN